MKKTAEPPLFGYAQDYQEPVLIVAVERKPKGDDLGRYTIRRSNGQVTHNYPGYLLEIPKE